MVVAHEIGHNFSSPHTHCYSPARGSRAGLCHRVACCDGVSRAERPPEKGTIMSYCHQRRGLQHDQDVPRRAGRVEPRRPDEDPELRRKPHPSCFGTAPGPKVTGISPPTGLTGRRDLRHDQRYRLRGRRDGEDRRLQRDVGRFRERHDDHGRDAGPCRGSCRRHGDQPGESGLHARRRLHVRLHLFHANGQQHRTLLHRRDHLALDAGGLRRDVRVDGSERFHLLDSESDDSECDGGQRGDLQRDGDGGRM